MILVRFVALFLNQRPHSCAICGSFPKTTLHTLGDCVKDKEMWKSIGHIFVKDSFFLHPLSEWLEENVINESRKLFGMDWPLIL